MPRSSAPLRRTVLAAAVALGAVGAVAYPAAASAAVPAGAPAAVPAAATTALPGASPAPSGSEAVELQLTPRDRAGLARLAAATGLSQPERLARLTPLLPGLARAAAVSDALRRDGLTVTAADALSVTAVGPAAVVTDLFGAEGTAASATAQPLPRVPAALASLVTVAYDSNDTRPAELPLGLSRGAVTTRSARTPNDGSLSIASARQNYGSTATTAAPTSSSPIVATLQFTTAAVVTRAISNAAAFAKNNGLYASSSYSAASNIQQVAVTGTGCGSSAGADDGDEVGLDTETLLSAAPQLRQRVYQVPNCGSGQDLAFDQILNDVTQRKLPIIALSTSWGACEEASYSAKSAAATAGDTDAVNALLAAGVTVFAASGDDGANDCAGSTSPGDTVDSPAAIPGVVAVGGTSGTTVAAATAWNDATGAGGGGFSCGYFSLPAYQSAVAIPASYPSNARQCPTGGSERMVPDIAENAGNGLDAVVTDSYTGCTSSCTARIVGTSFAAPLAAGGLAETMFLVGHVHGLGDIHARLYGDPEINDITTGSNGTYAATTGYDVATGLGSPNWSQFIASSSDLSAVSVTGGGVVQVRNAYAGTAFATAGALVSTGLTVSDPADWQFQFAPYNGDGAADLWAVQLGSSGHSLQVFSQASGYRTQLEDVASFPSSLTASQVTMRIGSYANDGRGDLFLIQTSGTASGDVELDAYSAASNYQTQLVAATTPIAEGNPDWTFLIGDKAHSGDLVGVLDGRSGSGYTEVHILSRTSGYRTFSAHIKTAMAEYNGNPAAQFSLRDVNGDGVPDVVLALVNLNASGIVSLHALLAPSFAKYGEQLVTGLPSTPSSATVTLASTT